MLEWGKTDRYPSRSNYQSGKREEYEEFKEPEESKTEQILSQTTQEFPLEELRRPANAKIDQLLAMLGQLVKVFQHQENDVKAPTKKQRELY